VIHSFEIDGSGAEMKPEIERRMPDRAFAYALACVLAMCAAPADADETIERDLFQTGLLLDETTDDFDRDEWFASYRNHRRSMAWPWQESQATRPDWGIDLRYNTGRLEDADFDARRFAALVGKRLSPAVYVELSAGRHRLQTRGSTEDLTNYEAILRLTPSEALELRVQSERDYLYRDGFVSSSIDEFLSGRRHSLGAFWLPRERLRIVGEVERRELSDDNAGQRYSFAVLYGISPGWPWIWFGVGGGWLSYDEQRPGYWSPDEFTSVGLRFQSSFPLTDAFEASIAANLDRIEEKGLGDGHGEYIDASLTYRLTSTMRLRLGARRINSIQRGDRWSQTTYMLSLAGALF
jgi:hypothetical protein